jgi:hypothetical protein
MGQNGWVTSLGIYVYGIDRIHMLALQLYSGFHESWWALMDSMHSMDNFCFLFFCFFWVDSFACSLNTTAATQTER